MRNGQFKFLSALRPRQREVDASDARIEGQVRANLRDLAYSNVPVTGVADLICIVMMALAAMGHINPWLLGGWVICAMGGVGARLYIWYRYRARSPAQRRRPMWTRGFVLFALCAGLTWGLVGPLMLFDLPEANQVLTIAVLLGVAAGAITAVAPILPAAFAFFAVMGGLVAAACLFSGALIYQGMGLLVFSFAVFSTAMARHYHRTLHDSVRVSMENAEMARSLKVARNRAEAASDAKSRFLANMSHELRTPLNAIIGFSEIMMSDGTGARLERNFKEYSGHIHASGRHLLDLINDILDLAKADSGQQVLEEGTFDLADVVETCMVLLQPLAEKQGVRLVNHVADQGVRGTAGSDVQVFADSLKFRQILLNLLTNAVKFTEAGGTVSISSVRLFDGGLTIYVRDTGRGMTKPQIKQALKPFTQIDQGYNKVQQGTGLGLPLTKALIELHGGILRLDSAPGRGTTAMIGLPEHRTIVTELPAEPEAGVRQRAAVA